MGWTPTHTQAHAHTHTPSWAAAGQLLATAVLQVSFPQRCGLLLGMAAAKLS